MPIVYWNGKFISQNEARASVAQPGFLLGYGLFETMRAYRGRIVYYNEHIQRLFSSCRQLGIKGVPGAQALRRNIAEAVSLNCLKDARVRLTVWKKQQGAEILITAELYQAPGRDVYGRGFQVLIAAGLYAPVTPHKTTNRVIYETAYGQARRKKYDEALLCTSLGYISEGTRSNIFWVKNEAVFTPALACGCLAGVTRKVVFDLCRHKGIIVEEALCTAQDLVSASEAFLTNSLFGIMPVRAIEGRKIGGKKNRKIIPLLTREYARLMRNENHHS